MTRLPQIAAAAAVAAAAALTSLPAAAQFQKPEDAIKFRQSALTVLANQFGKVGAMAAGKAPYDAKVAADATHLAALLAPLPWAGFGEGTDKGMPNRAKPEIWKDSAKFKAAADKMVAEMAKLEAASKAGNLDAIKPVVGEVGKACKACHDDFRAEKYSQ